MKIRERKDRPRLAPTLHKILSGTIHLEQVKKADLHSGDLIVVTTRNSVYSILVDESGSYLVSGGWFDRHGLSPVRTTILGCTFGGVAIKTDIVAACGLYLEFGNHVKTSSIQMVHVVQH